MSGALKQELGLEDPKPAEPSAQKDEFIQKFKTVIEPINENLQYTSAHAPRSKHDAHAAKKEVSYQACQAAMSKIDPEDPAVAKDDLDKVMSAIENVGKVIEEFKQGAEKAFNAWTARQPEVDKHADKVREMQEWGHPKAIALNGLADYVRGKANERSYDEATGALDQMVGKMEPIIADYEKQKEAQKEFDPAYQALQPRLEATRVCGFAALLQQKQELATGTEQIASATTAKDYVSAIPQLKSLESSVASFEARKAEIEAKKREYETALETLKPKLDTAGGKTVYRKLAQDKQNYEALKSEMEASAAAEDYEAALSKCNDLNARVDAYIQAVDELEAKKREYETALETLKPKLDTAGGKTVYQKLAQDKQNYEALKSEMESAAQGEDYENALSKCNDLTARVDAYIQAVDALEAKKREYETAKTTVQQKLDSIAQSTHAKLAPKKQEIETLKGQMESAAQTEDFETALAKANEIIAKVDEYTNAAKELEEKEKQYSLGNEALKPKLEEASKSQHPDAANLPTLRSQMETSAQNGEYDQAMKTQVELKGKVEAILATPKEAEAEGPRVLETLDRDSDSPGKGGGASTAPVGNQLGTPNEGHSDPAEGNLTVTPFENKHPEEKKDPNNPEEKKDPKDNENIETEAEFTIYKNKKILGFGSTKIGISLGPTGELGKVSVDVAAIKEKFKLFEAAGGTFDLDVKLAGKSEIKLKEGDIEKFKVKVKAEIQASFSKIPVKPGVNATADNKGEIVTALTLEFPIPGGEAPPTADRPKSAGKLPVTFENRENLRAILLTVFDLYGSENEAWKMIENRRRIEPMGKFERTVNASTYGKGCIKWLAQRVDDPDTGFRVADGNEEDIPENGKRIAVGLNSPLAWTDVAPSCDKFLDDHRFRAIKGEPIVAGDNPFDMYFDNDCIEIRAKTSSGHTEICNRLLTAIPELKDFRIDLDQLVTKRWEIAISRPS